MSFRCVLLAVILAAAASCSKPEPNVILSLDTADMPLIEEAFQLNDLARADRICILFLYDTTEYVFAFVRIDALQAEKKHFLDSDLITESQAMPIPLYPPIAPEGYDVKWWNLPERIDVDCQGYKTDLASSASTSESVETIVRDNEDGSVSIYLLQKCQLSRFTSAFRTFITAHSWNYKRIFPSNVEVYGGCWLIAAKP